MAVAGALGQASITVPGRSAAEVARIVASVARAERAYRVAPAGPDAQHLVRTYRPAWAVVVGVLGLPLFGLGALFFLVRRTESCTLQVREGPTGATLTIIGPLAPATLTTLRAALEAGTPLEAPEQSEEAETADVPAVPSEPDEPHDLDATQHRPAVRREAFAPRFWMRLPGGEIVALAGTTLLGRDPAPRPGDRAPTLIPLTDPQMLVSKTHAAVRVEADTIHIEDLHSTNGTVVSNPSGQRTPLGGGEVAAVPPGAVLELGSLRIEVGSGG